MPSLTETPTIPSASAEFVVAVCGDIMTMPGLPRVPAADSIDVDADGKIVELLQGAAVASRASSGLAICSSTSCRTSRWWSGRPSAPGWARSP